MSTCSICLSPMRHTRNSTKELSCGHIFHKQCINEWKGRSCPLCRRNVLPPRFQVKLSIQNMDTGLSDTRELDMDAVNHVLESLNLSDTDLIDYSTEIVFDVDNIDDLESVISDLSLDVSDFNPSVLNTE